MITEREFLHAVAGIRRDRLHIWIERGWLAPGRGEGGWIFREIDIARARLIRELSEDLDIGEDALDVVLPLLDQVHGLRRELRRLADAIDAQPEEIRAGIRKSLETDGR
jgi:chaperone modulatory protein CbpM